MKEPEIKLFGRKIVLPDNGGEVAVMESSDQSDSGSGGAVDWEGEREKADDVKHLPDEEVIDRLSTHTERYIYLLIYN